MTQHSSLKSGRRRKQHRSVLKRFERIAILKEKKEWNGENPVFGIPKVKTIRIIKVKKEKAAAETGTTAETAATEAQATPTPGKEKAALTLAKEKAAPPKKEKEK